MVQGQGPGPRYGHAMDLVAQRYLVTVGGNNGEIHQSTVSKLLIGQISSEWEIPLNKLSEILLLHSEISSF